MTPRTANRIQQLIGRPGVSTLVESLSHEGLVSGVGYEIDHVSPGRGYSSTEYGHKLMANGLKVYVKTYMPGPFDRLAGYPAEITEVYSVFVGWEKYREDDSLFDSPPGLELPIGATKWSDDAEYDRYWYADFDDHVKAEQFALSLPEYCEENYPPMTRGEP